MKEREPIYFCPFGEDCENIKDDKLYRCVFYVNLKGSNPQTDEKTDEWGCSISWLPVLLCENSKASRNTRDSVDKFKNEISRVGDNFIKAVAHASMKKKELENDVNNDESNIEEIVINEEGETE